MAITPNMANVDGHPIVMAADGTGAATSIVTLPTYAPKIDIRLGHPVLAIFAHDNTAFTAYAHKPAEEAARGTAVPGAGEWSIISSSVINVDNVGVATLKVLICYIPFGSQQA